MDLLTNGDRAEILAAVKDIRDTFFKTPVTYSMGGVELDRYMESATKGYTDVDLMALLEFPNLQTDNIQFTVPGAIDEKEVKLTLLFEDMQDLSLTDGNNVIFQSERDYFIANGIKYKVTLVSYDGPLTDTPVLVIVKGEKDEPKAV